MIARILIAAIPVAAMLVIEGVLSRKNRRRAALSRQDVDAASCRVEPDLTRRDVASTIRDQLRRDVASAGNAVSTRRWRQDGGYFQSLYQTAQAGSLSAMNKLGEFAFVRRNFVEAFYWKLMLEMRHGRPSGLPAQGVCRFWQDVGCPAPNTDEGGSFTENQSKLAMVVLDLWSGRHVHTPKETIRQMAEEGDKDALLCARRFGIGYQRS